MYEKVYRAGMIPYIITDSGQIKMMFMKPSDTTYGGDQFQIAKGRVDEGEDHRDAAIREAKEELGLFMGNVDNGPFHVDRFLGRTDMYVARVLDTEMFGEPSDETAETCWMTVSEFLMEGRPLHHPVVQACYREICRIEDMDIEY